MKMIKKPKGKGSESNYKDSKDSKTLPIRHSTIKEYTPTKRTKLPLTERGIING